jgi:hypothetical protein
MTLWHHYSNEMYCFFRFVGDFRSIEPPDAIH